AAPGLATAPGGNRPGTWLVLTRPRTANSGFHAAGHRGHHAGNTARHPDGIYENGPFGKTNHVAITHIMGCIRDHGAGGTGRSAGGRMSEQALDLKGSVQIIRRHWLIVLIVALLGLIGGTAYAVLKPPNLVSSALVQIVSPVSRNSPSNPATLAVVA